MHAISMEIASWCSLIRIRMFSLPDLQPLLHLAHAMDGHSSLGEGSSKSQAVSFSVGFEEPAKKPSRMPKHLSQATKKRKPELSEASIAEKQMMAEKRRKKHIEEKLEKIHQMEEEAQRLAQAMIPLIEASTITNGLNSRKLHRDNDIVRNVAAEVLDNHNDNECSSANGASCSEAINSSNSGSQH